VPAQSALSDTRPHARASRGGRQGRFSDDARLRAEHAEGHSSGAPASRGGRQGRFSDDARPRAEDPKDDSQTTHGLARSTLRYSSDARPRAEDVKITRRTSGLAQSTLRYSSDARPRAEGVQVTRRTSGLAQSALRYSSDARPRAEDATDGFSDDARSRRSTLRALSDAVLTRSALMHSSDAWASRGTR